MSQTRPLNQYKRYKTAANKNIMEAAISLDDKP